MSHILNHFSLQAAKWNGLVFVALVMIWIAVVACVVSSILAQPFDRTQRLFWIAVVIVLPFVGILAYLPFAIRREDLPYIFARRKRRPRRSKNYPTDAES